MLFDEDFPPSPEDRDSGDGIVVVFLFIVVGIALYKLFFWGDR